MRLSLALALSFLVPAAAGAACPPRTETLTISRRSVDGLGHFSGYPVPPLKAGQFILTFDDGPNPATTPAILSILRRECVPAHFFMVGHRVLKNPDVARSVAAGGFGIDSHSFSHRTLDTLPPEEAKADMARGVEVVRAIPGNARGDLFRFPSNRSSAALRDYARTLGLVVASTDLSPEDWRNDPPETSLARLSRALNKYDRGIITLHDTQPNTVKLLPMILKLVRDRGGSFVAVRVVP